MLNLRKNNSVLYKKQFTKARISMLQEVKSYMSEHRDIIFTLGLLFLADHFLLNGAIKTKLSAILSKTVDRLEKKVSAEG